MPPLIRLIVGHCSDRTIRDGPRRVMIVIFLLNGNKAERERRITSKLVCSYKNYVSENNRYRNINCQIRNTKSQKALGDLASTFLFSVMEVGSRHFCSNNWHVFKIYFKKYFVFWQRCCQRLTFLFTATD